MVLENPYRGRPGGQLPRRVWEPEVQYLRGVAILAILVVHTFTYYATIGEWNLLAVSCFTIDRLASFAVPLFLLIAGFVLSIDFYDNFSTNEFYHDRLRSIIPAFVIFSIFYLIAEWLWHGPLSPTDVFLKFTLFDAISYFFYLAIILEMYLIYPLLLIIFKHFEMKGRSGRLVVYVLVLQLAYNMFDVFLIAPNAPSGSYYWVVEQRIFLSSIFYFVLGIYVGRNYQDILEWVRGRSWAILLVMALALSIGISLMLVFQKELAIGTEAMNALSALVQPAFCVLMFALGFKAVLLIIANGGRGRKALASIGRYSFGIFFVNGLYLIMIVNGLGSIGIAPTQWFFYPIVLFGILGLSWITVIVLCSIPGGHHLFGVRTRIAFKDDVIDRLRGWLNV